LLLLLGCRVKKLSTVAGCGRAPEKILAAYSAIPDMFHVRLHL